MIAAKMSQEIGDETTHEFRLCDGTAGKPVYAARSAYHRTLSNEAVITASYGEILEFYPVPVQYIPEHDSYTILVTGTAMIPGIEHGNEIKKGEVLTLWLYHKPEYPADTDVGNACSMR